MQIVDCIKKMSIFYLRRITNSIVQEEVSKNADETQLQDHIFQNINFLADDFRIIETLNLPDTTRSNRILIDGILRNLLEIQDSVCDEELLYQKIQEYEKEILEKSNKIDLSSLINERDLDIFKTILELALEDDDISKEEYNLIQKLRKKLKITRLHKRLLEAQLGHYPKKNNELHNRTDFDDALKILQLKGIIFYCNKGTKINQVVLPKEIKSGVKKCLGFEMRFDAHILFHSELSKETLRKMAKSHNLPFSGTKDAISERLIEAGTKPSEQLNVLSSKELHSICSKLKGVNVSGTKEDKLKRIINYYENLNIKEVSDQDDPRERYYQYIEELAARKNEELYGIKLIKKDKQMEDFFEEATRYIFEAKFNIELINFAGNEHADGGFDFQDNELLLWDNKSTDKDEGYVFPDSDYKQFKRYINDSERRVKAFLIVVPKVAQGVDVKLYKLKRETRTNTDIAFITATDLKYLAENWKEIQGRDEFSPDLFIFTGELDRKTIDRLA